MVKIGPCFMIIEPHVFEVILYAVKESQAQTPLPPLIQSIQTPVAQYSQPNETTGRTPLLNDRQYAQNPSPTVRTNTDRSTTPHSLPGSNSITSNPQPPVGRSTPTSQGPVGPNSEQHRSAASQSAVPPKSSTDPVIQLLANRAATDYKLRDLMTIVASGNASPEELEVFQGHINDISASLRKKNELGAPQTGLSRTAGNTPAGRPLAPVSGEDMTNPVHPNSGSVRPDYPSGPHSGASRQVTPSPRPSIMNSNHHNANYHAPRGPVHTSKPEGSSVSHRPETTAVVFEFVAGSGDRFLFPKYSILDFSTSGTQVIASFLVVRKGSDSDSSASYESEVEYYQPVTIRISAASAKILDPLARVVAHPTEARKYMNEVMDRTTRAENARLAIRLPRDPETINEGGTDKEGSADREHGQNGRVGAAAYHTPSGSTGPSSSLKRRASTMTQR